MSVYRYNLVMLELQMQDVKRLTHAFEIIGRDVGPKVVRRSLDGVAFRTAKLSKERTIHEKMEIRTPFVERSIRYKKARGANIQAMQSEAGSMMDGMRRAEEGSTNRAKGDNGVSIPTRYASGESRGSTKRSKRVTGRNKMQRIQLRDKQILGKNWKQTLIMRVVNAVETGQREIFFKFETGKQKTGIFRVVGGRKRGQWKGRGIPKGVHLEMIHDLTEKQTTVDPHKWLEPASGIAYDKFPTLFAKEWKPEVEKLRRFVVRK